MQEINARMIQTQPSGRSQSYPDPQSSTPCRHQNDDPAGYAGALLQNFCNYLATPKARSDEGGL